MLRLPPLNALRAFESAARHLSFKRAAEELCVSPGAISRHIINLEDHLGVKLFERRYRQVRLTPNGTSYLYATHAAFIGISNATNALMDEDSQKMLKLKLPPTCAIRWLVPRLARFHARHPDLSVQVTTSHDAVDFNKDDIDAGISYGTEIGPGLMGERLFSEVLVPVLSPSLAAQIPDIHRPEGLSECTLLHSLQRPDDWPQWFKVAGVPEISTNQGLIFENSSLTYQGVIEGLGIAIAQLAFVIDELKSGRLITPFNIHVHNPSSYYFVFPKENAKSAKIQRLHAWITHEASLTREIGAKYAI
ncbi:MAG TPA: transcriptional regulator GcvA [Kiloniellales bacterium]|jgi:LysR family glycine cleavage system transcriptional activator